jgi:Na+/citrate or Na+/malate symporter
MHLRNIVPVGAIGAAVGFSPVVLVLMLVLIIVASACFLRWFVNLSPARRADVLRLMKGLRGR